MPTKWIHTWATSTNVIAPNSRAIPTCFNSRHAYSRRDASWHRRHYLSRLALSMLKKLGGQGSDHQNHQLYFTDKDTEAHRSRLLWNASVWQSWWMERLEFELRWSGSRICVNSYTQLPLMVNQLIVEERKTMEWKWDTFKEILANYNCIQKF